MIADDPKAVFITLLARELHLAGVASDSLEETISATAEMLDLELEVFALPTTITVAFGSRYEQRIVMLRVNPERVNLRKIAVLNEIFDRLQAGKIDLAHATEQLRHIDDRAPHPSPLLGIASLGMIALGVAVVLGGGVNELIVAALIGVVTGALDVITERVPAIKRLYEALAAFVGTLIVAAYGHWIAPANLYISIVAGVVVLLPGYSLTLALHELANRFLIAGTARLGQVFAVLLALGCGALLAFALVGPHLLVEANIRPHPVGATYWIAAVVLMSLGLSIELNARVQDFLWVFCASFVAFATSHLFGLLPAHQVTAFASALVCGIVANLGARFLRVPQPILLVPALIVLVPGSLSYESILYIFSQNYMNAAVLATNAIVAAVLLVAGLLLSQLVFPASTLRVRPSAHII